jgi:hypothetical protein
VIDVAHDLAPVRSGDVIDDRFEIGDHAGSGGMSEVFRARDRASSEQLAVKVLRVSDRALRARFMREVAVLAELRHPAIVRYVAHGETAQGEPFLAMEWLDGEDLASRLERGSLGVDESVALAARVADALAAAHARGVIHRDLKPSNLFLVSGDAAQIKVLDFGIAAQGGVTRLTQAGALLGTLGYMAPEQARSSETIKAAADVFSLGCVLFECLTGQRAFTGDHPMALLTKILFDDVPRVRELHPEIPAPLDALVASMLAKDQEDRPRDGAAVLAALSADSTGSLGRTTAGERRPSVVPPSLGRGERRLLAVVLIGQDRSVNLDETRRIGDARLTPFEEALWSVAAAHEGRFDLLADGSMVASIAGSTSATDLATQAARCALALHRAAEGSAIALTMGHSDGGGRRSMGDAIDRAARMIAPGASDQAIAIDEVIAGLLDARFDVRAAEAGLSLHGERALGEGGRTLLGKLTPCVGRDWELAMLKSTLTECVEEPVARAALVTGAAGSGKSRLLHEFLRTVRERGRPLEIWIGRGDSLRAGSAFAMLGEALRGASGIRDGEPLVTRRQKLWARLSRCVPEASRRRVAEFLGELVGTPLPDDDSAPLRAARQDAQLMGEQMRSAWEDFVRAEASAQPVLLVLDDLHWCDLPTVRFVDAALRSLEDQPFMVLALARPEIHELFPKLWAERSPQEIRLRALPLRVSERLVRQVLGESIDDPTVKRIAALADGNAFYLEELIRAAAEGRGDALPETVLSMVEARLGSLPAEARRLLRAASVFGEVFWAGGVASLSGVAEGARELDSLVDLEVLVRRPESRFPGEEELAFRHVLLREGAYAMLLEADRALGHRLAGAWLKERGESDPMVLAEHFERGGDPAGAGRFYLRAATLAQQGGDIDTMVDRVRRGLASGPPDPVRLSLLSLLSVAQVWRGEWAAALATGEEVMRLSVLGGSGWLITFAIKLLVKLNLGEGDIDFPPSAMLREDLPVTEAPGIFAYGYASLIFGLDMMGQIDLASAGARRLEAIIAPIAARDPIARAWMNLPLAYQEPCSREDPWKGLLYAEAARASFEEAGDRRSVLIAETMVGMNLWMLGALDRAERTLRGTLKGGVQRGLGSSLRTLCMAGVLADLGAFEEAREFARRMVEFGGAERLLPHEVRGRWLLAEILRREGDLEGAEREARAAWDRATILPVDQAMTTATLAAIHLARGRAAPALAAAEDAMARYEALGAFGFRGGVVRLVHIEALAAIGDHARAGEALAVARARLLANAAKIGDPELRQSFLERILEHARILAPGWNGR